MPESARPAEPFPERGPLAEGEPPPEGTAPEDVPDRTVTVLAVDGGGIRGLIPALLLADMEAEAGLPIASLFDLIAGTSTGGLLTLGLSKPDPGAPGQPQYSAAEIADLYRIEGPRIFSRSLLKRLWSVGNLLDEKYSDDGLNDVLRRYLGEVRLKEALTNVLVTAYALEERRSYFFKSERARRAIDHDVLMREAARATAAAPTYFEPARLYAPPRTLIDGGVYANNPTMCAFVEARTLFPEAERFLVVSLGTGEQEEPIPFRKAKDWGLVEWARPLFDVVLDGVSDTVDYQMRTLLNPRGATPQYIRFQIRLDGASGDLDDASPDNLRALERLADDLRQREAERLRAVCERLKALRPAGGLGPAAG